MPNALPNLRANHDSYVMGIAHPTKIAITQLVEDVSFSKIHKYFTNKSIEIT